MCGGAEIRRASTSVAPVMPGSGTATDWSSSTAASTCGATPTDAGCTGGGGGGWLLSGALGVRGGGRGRRRLRAAAIDPRSSGVRPARDGPERRRAERGVGAHRIRLGDQPGGDRGRHDGECSRQGADGGRERNPAENRRVGEPRPAGPSRAVAVRGRCPGTPARRARRTVSRLRRPAPCAPRSWSTRPCTTGLT